MSRKILVVDDNPTIRDVLTAMLGIHGYDVQVCRGVADAKAALDTGRFDALVCDIHLEDGLGIDVVAHARRVRRLLKMPIVVLSVDDSAAFREAARANGADAFATKPIGAARLRTILQQLWDTDQG